MLFRPGRSKCEVKRYNWGNLSGKPDGYAGAPVCLINLHLVVLEGVRSLSAAAFRGL